MPTTVPGVKSPPIQASIEFQCLPRGGVQSFTITTTPAFKISWGTAYADGGTHASTGTGVIPATGTLRVPWTVAADVPFGAARTDIAIVGEVDHETEAAYRHLEWRTAQSC
ncbi:MAG: hypothetical protein ABR548_03095 [Actinomycetota bacterium]|nr:hypothetical protein [Actinomycetota bacterium]